MTRLKLRYAAVLAIAVFCAASALAHDIITTNLTYTRDISRILARRCLVCHDSGASIPLTSYEQVRPWAVDIKEQVLSRAMPPWGAVKGFGDLAPDRALSQEEVMIIAAWVIGGAPNGDPAMAPNIQHAAAQNNLTLKDIRTITTRTTLDSPVSVLGIRPLATVTVDSSRITARLPDGRIEPLVWLYRYSEKSNRVFFFRQPLALPRGTVIEASDPLRFALEGHGP